MNKLYYNKYNWILNIFNYLNINYYFDLKLIMKIIIFILILNDIGNI